MRELVKMPIRVSEEEAWTQFEYAKSRAVVRTAQLHWAWFARFVTPVSEDAVTAYMAEHQAELLAAAQDKDTPPVPAPAAPAASTDHATPGSEPAAAAPVPAAPEGCTLVSEIFLGYPPAADASDEAALQAKARDVKKQLSQGRSFELLARVHSSASTGAYGGLRGCLRASDGEEASSLLASIAGLKTGEVSEPLTMPHGVYLLKLEARLDPTAADSAEQRAGARPLAARAAADARAQRFASDLLAAVRGGQSLSDAVTALTSAALKEMKAPAELAKEIEALALEAHDRPRVDISPGFSRVDGINPIPNLSGDVSAKQLAFTLNAPDELYPEPLVTRDGLVVLQLKEKTLANRADFAKDKAALLRDVRENLQDDALARYIQGLRDKAKDAIILNPRFLDSAPESPADES
jgi:hypothetical protein